MSRFRFALARALGSVLFLASACTVNGKAIGPHFGGAATSSSSPSSSQEVAAPSSFDSPGSSPSNATIPEVAGLSRDAAIAKVRAAGFGRVETREACLGEADVGHACGTEPGSGQRQSTHLIVVVDVASEPDPNRAELVVPDITGMPLDDAKRAVAQAGFTGGVTEQDNDRTGRVERSCNPGTICQQRPEAGERYGVRHPIRIVVGVSTAPVAARVPAPPPRAPDAAACAQQQVPLALADGRRHYVALPDVAGLDGAEAEKKLRAAGFDDVDLVLADCHPKRPMGTVCGVDPEPGCYLNTKLIQLEVSATE